MADPRPVLDFLPTHCPIMHTIQGNSLSSSPFSHCVKKPTWYSRIPEAAQSPDQLTLSISSLSTKTSPLAPSPTWGLMMCWSHCCITAAKQSRRRSIWLTAIDGTSGCSCRRSWRMHSDTLIDRSILTWHRTWGDHAETSSNGGTTVGKAISSPITTSATLSVSNGSGNTPAVQVWMTITVSFGCGPVPNPDPLTLGGPIRDPYPSTRWFGRVWADLSVPISSSVFRVSHLWSHSDMVLLIVKKCHGYVAVHLEWVGRLNNQNVQTDAPYHILKMSVNGASMIVGRVSWVIWGCEGSNIVITKVLTAFIAKNANETIPIPSWKSASTEDQRFWVVHYR